MDGIINLDKPPGITSAKALYRVRTLTGQRKSGHGGTLDPAASGVLLLCLGRATKLVEKIMDQPKVYRASARLDVTSESFDSDRALVAVIPKWAGITGSRDRGIEVCPSVPPCQGGTTGGSMDGLPTREGVSTALHEFEGEIHQVPPAISAVKVAGQPAYKRRASDAPLELKPRAVRIYWIHLHSYEWPMIDFEMCCGRGTYVRALIRDLGERLGTGGCLTSLARTRIGPFALEDAWTMEAIAAVSQPDVAQSTIDPAILPERSTIKQESAASAGVLLRYLVPMQEAVRLLSPDSAHIPPRPE